MKCPEQGSSVESGSKLVAAQDQAVGIVDKENDNRERYRVSFKGDENAPSWRSDGCTHL